MNKPKLYLKGWKICNTDYWWGFVQTEFNSMHHDATADNPEELYDKFKAYLDFNMFDVVNLIGVPLEDNFLELKGDL